LLKQARLKRIDKNFLFVGRSILSADLYVKNILPQDVKTLLQARTLLQSGGGVAGGEK
jgi:hypothetical protein